MKMKQVISATLAFSLGLSAGVAAANEYEDLVMAQLRAQQDALIG